MKKVSELTAEEFKKAFPIEVKAYNKAYKARYGIERDRILGAIDPEGVVRINHIGSTAVEGLLSKPMVDILLEMDGCCNVTKLLDALKGIEYGVEILTRREDPLRLLLAKGCSVDGFAEQVYLLHVRYVGDWDELYFRDYLIAHPEVSEAYAQLKLQILKDIEEGRIERLPNGNPNGYSNAKLDFVRQHTEIARREFENRYKPAAKA